MLERRHAIIIIRNDKGEYLQYFDERWNSYLFLNCKIKDEFDTKSIENEVYLKLNMRLKKIEYKMDRIHVKFSESDKINKEYHHYFYVVEVENLSSIADKKEFKINKTNFKWYFYDEFLQDERIQKVNSDIIGFIKEI